MNKIENLGFDPDGVGVANGNYFGMPYTVEEAALVLVSVPWDVTVSYGEGTSYAPDALIEASTMIDFYDEAAPDQWRKGIATSPIDYSIHELSQRLRVDAQRIIRHLEKGGSMESDVVLKRLRKINVASDMVNAQVENLCRNLLKQGKIVGLVGGDHSTSYGAIAAIAAQGEKFGVLHIDAHRDLREAYEGFVNSHASAMYNVLECVEGVERLVQVAVRDYSEGEQRYAQTQGERVKSFTDRDLCRAKFEGRSWREITQEIIDTLPQRVYVSFDIDGLSVENCPNTGTPVSGGLSFNEALYLIEMIAQTGRTIVGFDLVEVTPKAGVTVDAAVGARLLWRLCGEALRGC